MEKLIGFSPYIITKGEEEFLASVDRNKDGAEIRSWSKIPDLAMLLTEEAAEHEAKAYGKGAKVCAIIDCGDRFQVAFK